MRFIAIIALAGVLAGCELPAPPPPKYFIDNLQCVPVGTRVLAQRGQRFVVAELDCGGITMDGHPPYVVDPDNVAQLDELKGFPLSCYIASSGKKYARCRIPEPKSFQY